MSFCTAYGAVEGSPRQQTRRIERRKLRVRVVDDERDLRATEHDGVASFFLLQSTGHGLKVRDLVGLEHAAHQLAHDDSIHLVAFGGIRTNGRQSTSRERLGIHVTVDQPTRARNAEPPEAARRGLGRTTSAMCSHGSGERDAMYGSAW